MSKLTERLPAVLRDPVVMPWVLTAAMVAAAFLFRLQFQKVLGGGLAYSTFYPAVILAAYAFGRGPAVVAAAVSSVLAFFCFVEPVFAWKATPTVLAAFGFFTLVCAVAILVITGLTGALKSVSHELGRAQAVADSHAGLFRELNERMTHHMRLVAGILALQAKGEPEPQVADSLKRAMERTLLISRVHRELGGGSRRPWTSTPSPPPWPAPSASPAISPRAGPDRVVRPHPGHGGGDLLGVALAECLGALFDTGVAGPLCIRFGADGRQAEVAISEAGDVADGALVSVTNGYLLRAMTEQLGAAVALRADARGSALVLSMPRAASPAAAEPVSTLH